MNLSINLITILSIFIFSKSFFLTRKSFPHLRSGCDDAVKLLQEVLHLSCSEIDYLQRAKLIGSRANIHDVPGCWSPRRVDNVFLFVVDALRIDLMEKLELSIGSRSQNKRAFKYIFRADPPTVTMQRLLALVTGGLPTFADISYQFGGSRVEDDSWIHQLKSIPYSRRSSMSYDKFAMSKLAFVGDDTWADLLGYDFFHYSYPYPSFNTRDLYTVDNGCWEKIPKFMDEFFINSNEGTNNKLSMKSFIELAIVHTLGVDHVGHTFGPLNDYMEEKLTETDRQLDKILSQIDKQENECKAAFVFGDHGMLDDGNHGGSAPEEMNAGLFVYFSPACTFGDYSGNLENRHHFDSYPVLNQIDFVPTVSLLLGLPVPFANLGSVALELLPQLSENENINIQHEAIALALNAAQVWNYFTVYARESSHLPSQDMKYLEHIMERASESLKYALASKDEVKKENYIVAMSEFSLFLSEATDVGQRSWTSFNIKGMIVGIVGALIATTLAFKIMWSEELISGIHSVEFFIVVILVIFTCFFLTFGNSYLLSESEIHLYTVFVVAIMILAKKVRTKIVCEEKSVYIIRTSSPFIFIVCSRIHDLMVSGHGVDPSLLSHAAQYPFVFSCCLVLLIVARILRPVNRNMVTIGLDVHSIFLIGLGWFQKVKKSSGHIPTYHGMLMSIFAFLIKLLVVTGHENASPEMTKLQVSYSRIFNFLILLMALTGPSAAASAVLVIIQAIIFLNLMEDTEVPSITTALLIRATIRHIFFTTGHSCSLNALQLSSAFVATDEFNFVIAGVSLFLNTFGWEILGLALVYVSKSCNVNERRQQQHVWNWLCFFQLLETTGSCLSVTLLRRHLFTWDIFAPRLMYSVCFTTIIILFTTHDYMTSILIKKTVWSRLVGSSMKKKDKHL